jgi:ABC-type transport system involved in cytochrome c biogenesis permease subunit
MDLESLSLKMLDASAFAYLASAVFYVLAVARKKTDRASRMLGVASVIFTAAFVSHTAGLTLRWVEAGIDRPPWTNLYESLVFFAWGLALFQALAIYRWKVSVVGLISVPLVFLLMGMSVMTTNRGLEPLLPSLQSNWLKIHVIFGMISYSAFSISACIAYLHLMRRGVSLTKISLGIALMTLLNMGIAGGYDFFYKGDFYMARTKVVTMQDGSQKRVKDVVKEYEGGPSITRMEKVNGAKWPFNIALLLFAASAVYGVARGRKLGSPESEDPSAEEAATSGKDLDRTSLALLGGGTVALGGVIAAIIVALKNQPEITIQSNPYLTMLLVTTLFFIGAFWVIYFSYRSFLSLLPSALRLDELGYKNILFGFPFQTLLLITGAIWAYYAWGRSWGWDPKETWALITWLAYLIYLHGKLLMRWKPVLLSVVSIISFMILVFAFLGVNLVLSGLHSYGAA